MEAKDTEMIQTEWIEAQDKGEMTRELTVQLHVHNHQCSLIRRKASIVRPRIRLAALNSHLPSHDRLMQCCIQKELDLAERQTTHLSKGNNDLRLEMVLAAQALATGVVWPKTGHSSFGTSITHSTVIRRE